MNFPRFVLLVCSIMLFLAGASAQEEKPLHQCLTPEEIEARLLLPLQDEDGLTQPAGVQRGWIRYIAQRYISDRFFCRDYWLGGEEGSVLDLTARKDAHGQPYAYYCGNMCTRAVYSMALSYLGVDCTPGDMSRLTGKRNLDEPYDSVSAVLGQVERVTYPSYVFQNMFENYVSDPSYSPIMLHLEKPDGTSHALLVIANDEGKRYLVIDPSMHTRGEEELRVYRIRFNKVYKTIVNATFASEYVGSKLLGLYQWRLLSN